MMYKKFYHPYMSSSVICPTCGYGFVVDGVPANTSASGHAGRYAIDEGGQDGSTNDWLIVPKEGSAYICVRVTNRGGLNVAMFETTEKVIFADGEIDIGGLELIHCGNADFAALGIAVGMVFQPGDRFYREGTGGCSSGHVHIQAYKGHTGGSWHKCTSGQQMDNEAPLTKIAFVPKGHAVLTGRPHGTKYPYHWTVDNADPIGEAVITVQGLRVRTGPGTEYSRCADWPGAGQVQHGHRYAIYEMRGDWGRIGPTDRWICLTGYTVYTPYEPQRVQLFDVRVNGATLGDAERIADHAKALGLEYEIISV